MIDPKAFESISGALAQFLQNKPDLPGQEAMQQHLKSVLQSSFSKLDLVTREEFDTQTAVLAKTREKIEALEKRLAQLEAELAESSK